MRAAGGILEVAGVKGFNENRPDFKRRADIGGETESRFVEAWLERGHLVGVSPGELLPIADGIFTLNGDGDENKARSLGHRLRKMADKSLSSMVADTRFDETEATGPRIPLRRWR